MVKLKQFKRDNVLLMSSIHLKQSLAWMEMLLSFNDPKREFKYLLNIAYGNLQRLNKFLDTNGEQYMEEEYELSAQISDAILEISNLSDKQRERIYDLIEEIKQENEPQIMQHVG